MKNTRKILTYALLVVLVGLIIAASIWYFWITLFSLMALLNAALGLIGASIMFTRFFKRKLCWETIGIWSACLFLGVIVFAVAWNYKPRYITV